MWSRLEGPIANFVLAAVLLVAALALLGEYRRIFMSNPRAAMSAEVLMLAIARAGGPGYLAAFLLAGAVLNVAVGLITLYLNFTSRVPA